MVLVHSGDSILVKQGDVIATAPNKCSWVPKSALHRPYIVMSYFWALAALQGNIKSKPNRIRVDTCDGWKAAVQYLLFC